MQETNGKNEGRQALGQLIIAVAALLWEVFAPRNDRERK